MNDATNQESEPDEQHARTIYVTSLLRNAFQRRNLRDLSMAFRAHKPDWGIQSVLTSLGLTDFLVFLDWDYTVVREAFPFWYRQAEQRTDPQLLALRVSQIREFTAMVERPRELRLRPNLDSELGPERATLYTGAANMGALYSELNLFGNVAVASQPGQADLGLSAGYVLDCAQRFLLEKEMSGQLSITALQYLHAVHEDDRRWHPNVISNAVMEYFRQVSVVSTPPGTVRSSGRPISEDTGTATPDHGKFFPSPGDSDPIFARNLEAW